MADNGMNGPLVCLQDLEYRMFELPRKPHNAKASVLRYQAVQAQCEARIDADQVVPHSPSPEDPDPICTSFS